jgi:hypothetical protein
MTRVVGVSLGSAWIVITPGWREKHSAFAVCHHRSIALSRLWTAQWAPEPVQPPWLMSPLAATTLWGESIVRRVLVGRSRGGSDADCDRIDRVIRRHGE